MATRTDFEGSSGTEGGGPLVLGASSVATVADQADTDCRPPTGHASPAVPVSPVLPRCGPGGEPFGITDKRLKILGGSASRAAVTRELPLMTRLAVRAVHRTERLCVSLEREFGRERLLRAVDAIDADRARNHVNHYRRLIRTNEWPNAVLGIGDEAFLDHYERAALVYIKAGFNALAFVEDPNVAPLADVHRDVLSSEALRGQYGKSSPDGLDRRLERCEDDLLEHLDHEDELILLGTLPTPLMTAEDYVIRDFVAMQAVVPRAPSLEDVLSLEPEAAEPVWVFLRRHARWRIDSLARAYNELGNCVGDLDADLTRRALATTARNELFEALCPEAARFADLLTAFNLLNLTLEPAYSFKGGVGLLHGVVFAAAQDLASTPTQRQLVLDRQQFFHHHLTEGAAS